MPLEIGQIIHNNRYRIDSLLGKGGMGAVYKAWDTSLGLPVAIKENMDASPEAQKQFSREAGLLARLSHPNLPRVTDYFFIENQGQYLVMDYVEGEDLAAMIARLGRLPEPQVLAWISQVCEALGYLHSQPQPIIHRDIKPANIRINPQGKAMLVDFGIAKIYDPHLATTIGAKAVTPGYSPPEQYGGGHTDMRSDIYSLGATLYTLLTGQVPPESVSRMVTQQPLPAPHTMNPAISPQVEQIILKSVEIATERRFQSVEELRTALSRPTGPQTPRLAPTEVAPAPPRTAARPPVQPTWQAPPASTPRAQPRQSSLPGWLVILGALLLGGVVLVIGGLVGYKWLSDQGSLGKVEPTITAPTLATDTPTAAVAVIEQPGDTPTLVLPAPARDTPTLVLPLGDTPTPAPFLPTYTPTPVLGIPIRYRPVAQLKNQEGFLFRGVAEKDGFVYGLVREGVIYIYDLNRLALDWSSGEMVMVDTPVRYINTVRSNGLLRNGEYLYAYGDSGIEVYGLADPANPVLLATKAGYGAFNLALSEDGVMLAAPGPGGVALYAVKDPAALEGLAFIKTNWPGTVHAYGAAFSGSILYVSGFVLSEDQSWLDTIDISNPTAPTTINSQPTSQSIYQLFRLGGELVGCSSELVMLYSLANPIPSFSVDAKASARNCLMARGLLVTNGQVWQAGGGYLVEMEGFETYGSGPGDGFPYRSAYTYERVFLAQSEQILVLAAE
ncbi:MAG: protein kinase [Anaerolineales bacterium]|nr:protein kinase [Anaerolineales bacterium]